jgi:SAV_6107-like HEPN
MSRPVHAAPLPLTAVDLLRRADAELLAAQFSPAPAEMFTHAHLAALRAAAAVIAVRGRPTGRRAPRTAWDMLAVVAPEAAGWSTFFAAGAPLRLAVDAGRDDAVDAEHAERTLCAAEDFLDEVRALLEPGAAPDAPAARPLRAVRAS